MSTLGALTAAWRLVGVVRRERALRLLPALSDEKLPDWCALAEDEALVLYDGWGQYHYQALMNLAYKLRELRGPTTG
jgi:hypothetical protein